MGASEVREEQATLLRAIFEHAREAIFVTDATGRYVDVNPAACALTGYARDELLAMKIGDLALHSAASEELWRRLVERGRAEGEQAIRRKDGAVRLIEYRTVADIIPDRHLGVVRDVTDRVQAERELAASRDRLRRLTAELTRTEERERRELASLLHDEVGHGLALAHMRVAQIQALASGDDATGELRALAEILDRTVAAVRSLTFELSSPLLHELGPEAALEWLVEETERRHGLRVSFRAEASGAQLPEEVRNFLFKAARELIMNVVKHAGADQAELRLEVDAARAALTVQDAGRGFDPQRPPGTAGFGLFYLVERARALGGELDVQSGRDGTIVRVTVARNPPEAP